MRDNNNNNNNNNNNLDERLVDNEQSYRWLYSGDIKGETESTIVAAQEQVISSNYFKNKILKKEIQTKCRFCFGMPHFGEERIFNETQ